MRASQAVLRCCSSPVSALGTANLSLPRHASFLATATRSGLNLNRNGSATIPLVDSLPSPSYNRTFRGSSSGPLLLLARQASSSSSSTTPPHGSRIRDDFDPRILRLVRLTIYAGIATVIGTYMLDSRAAFHRYVTLPLVHRLVDPEEAHRYAVELAKIGLSPVERVAIDDDVLEIELFGRKVANPIGLAAGFDKHGECIDAMLDAGFGLVEVGSVVPEPQPGNPKPRMFRLMADDAAINRYGLNSPGADVIRQRMGVRVSRFLQLEAGKEGQPTNPSTPEELGLGMSLRSNKLLGVNVAKNKTSPEDSNEDYVIGVQKMGPLADYITVNVSCPNQHGITSLQRKGVIESVIKDVLEARDALPNKPPVLVKIGPDNSDEELADIAAAALACGVDGAIVSNTTNQRPASLKSDPRRTSETGGLSGPPLKPLALSTLRKFYRLTGGRIPLIGCGGITSAQDALEFARAGASAVQLYTGMAYRGPGIVYEIKKGIKETLEKEGKTWREIVGSGVRA